MNRMVRGGALAAALAALIMLAGCGGNGGQVRDDVAVADLSAAVEAEIAGSDGLVDPGESYIAGSMKLDTAALGEYVIKISAYSTSINEYGVFKTGSAEEAEALEQTLKEYLSMRNETWMSEYLPEEYPKLENAQVKREGSYVAYAILSEEERDGALDAFSAKLTE